MNAFSAPLFLHLRPPGAVPTPRALTSPLVRPTFRPSCPCAKASNSPKSSRGKRPRPQKNSSGFAQKSYSSRPVKTPPPASPQKSGDRASKAASPAEDATERPPSAVDGNDSFEDEDDVGDEASRKKRELQKLDANGISLEHRLREEIQHPLRKPKLTLFGTLSFSATLGFFFALGRLAANKDSVAQVSKNVVIDIAAIAVFSYLAWREVDFGRRSLNSIAGIPEPRDLRVTPLPVEQRRRLLPFGGGRNGISGTPDLTDTPKMVTLSSLLPRDVVVVAGRSSDVRKYLERCAAEAGYASGEAASAFSTAHPAVVAFTTDGREGDEDTFHGATAVSGRDAESKADWVAWLGDAVPPRKNLALFRIESSDKGRDGANAYVVTVDDPLTAPLPGEVEKAVIVEV